MTHSLLLKSLLTSCSVPVRISSFPIAFSLLRQATIRKVIEIAAVADDLFEK